MGAVYLKNGAISGSENGGIFLTPKTGLVTVIW